MPGVPLKFLPNNSVISVWLGALFSVASKVCNKITFAIAEMMEGLTLLEQK